MQDKSRIDYILNPFDVQGLLEASMPELLDPVYGYPSGQDNRRKRREQKRKNKKK